MNNVLCPMCDSDRIDPIDLSVMRCLDCNEYFDIDDLPERVQKIPKRQKFDDEF